MPSFALSSLDEEMITRDKNQVAIIKSDKLRWHGGFRARHTWVAIQVYKRNLFVNRFVYILDFICLQACKFAKDNLRSIYLPILIFQGGKDKLVVPQGSNIIHENVSSQDKTLKFYPEAYHNLFIELDYVKKDVFTIMSQWLAKRI